MEKFEQNQESNPEKPIDKWPYFSETPSSKEFIAAKKFTEKYIISGKYESDLSDTPENIQAIKNYIQELGKNLIPGISIDEVVNELKKAGVISQPQKVEKSKKEKQSEFLETNYVKLNSLKEADLSEDQLKILEANLLFEELEKENVFKNKEELENIYTLSLELQKNRIESEEYYYEFSNAGLIKGGAEEVKNDLEALSIRKNQFNSHETSSDVEKNKLEKAKKIATITERALAYGVTELAWYGKEVSIVPVSEFDDIKRGVDDILEIRKEDDESSFMALGIDVTFRGLYSEQFKQKFFNLLQSIRDGHKTKVKYFKNHKNELMKEFSIPKMVLYFNVNDVKDMVDILRKEKEDVREDSQKINVLSQVIQSCTILADFAEEYQNNIFRRYVAVKNSFKELGWKNKDVQKILDTESNTEVSRHLTTLVKEFKLIDMQKESQISHAA